MHTTISFTLLVAAALATPVANAETFRHRDAICQIDDQGACVVHFNLQKSGRAYFRVQRFDDVGMRWTSIGAWDRPWQPGDAVEAGGLYRVTGCDDRAGTQNCVYSRIFWAPIITGQQDIPSQVRIADGEGGESWAAVSTADPLAAQLRQLNVYRLTDIMIRGDGAIRGRMTRPVEHRHEAGFPHDENMIHHDVYQQFNELQRRIRGDGGRQ